MTTLTPQSSPADVLANAATPEESRERWNSWLALLDHQQVQFWIDPVACHDCIHRDDEWCMREQLPINVHRKLTLIHGYRAQACQMEGYQGKNGVKFGNAKVEMPAR